MLVLTMPSSGVSRPVYTNVNFQFIPKYLLLTLPTSQDILDKDEFWREELLKATKDRLFGCYLDSLAGNGVATDSTTTNGTPLLSS